MMCNCSGHTGWYNDEEVTPEEQDAYLKEKEAILTAKLETVRYLRQMLTKETKSEK